MHLAVIVGKTNGAAPNNVIAVLVVVCIIVFLPVPVPLPVPPLPVASVPVTLLAKLID